MPTRYIGLKEMQQLTGKIHQTLWRLWTERKEFPPPYKTKSGTFFGLACHCLRKLGKSAGGKLTGGWGNPAFFLMTAEMISVAETFNASA